MLHGTVTVTVVPFRRSVHGLDQDDRHSLGRSHAVVVVGKPGEGAGVQDIFIFPSRATKEAEPQPDGEYGSSIRMFNKAEGYYDVVYTCDHCMKRLCFTKQGEKLVGKVLSESEAKPRQSWKVAGVCVMPINRDRQRDREECDYSSSVPT